MLPDKSALATMAGVTHDDNDLLMHHATANATATSSTDLQRADLNAFTSTGFTISYAIANTSADLFSFYVVWKSETTDVHNIKTGRLQKTTATTRHSVSVRGLGFRPKALIIYSSGAVTDNAFTDFYTPAIGFSDGTNERTVSAISMDAVATMDTATQLYDAAIVTISTTTPTISDRGNALFFGDGFDIDFVVSSATARYYSYVVLGGSNIANVKVGEFTHSNATGNQSSTDAGFTPDLVLFLPTRGTTNQTGHAHAAIGFGAMEKTGTQMSIFNVTTDNVADSTNHRIWENANCIVNLAPAAASGGTATIDSKASFVSMDTNGWTINWSDAHPNATDLIFYLAIKGGQYHINSFTTPVGGTGVPNTAGVTAPGFEPKGIMVVSGGLSALATVHASNVFSMGAVTNPAVAAEQNFQYAQDGSAVATSVTARRTEENAILFNATLSATASASTILIRADVSAFNSNGFDVTTTTVHATEIVRNWPYIAFGEYASVLYQRTLATETLTIGPSVIVRKFKLKTLSVQTLVIGASAILTKFKLKSMTVQTLVIGASTIVRRFKLKTLAVQTVVIGASAIIIRAKPKIATQTVVIGASTTITRVKRAIATQTVVLGASAILTRARIILANTVVIGASTIIPKSRRTINQTLVIGASTLLTRVKRIITPQSLTVGADTILSRKRITISETAKSLLDNMSKRLLGKRTISEAGITQNDSIIPMYRQKRILAEPSIATADTLTKRAFLKRTVSEAVVSLNATLSRVYRMFRSITESGISFIDALLIKAGRTIAESFTISPDTVNITTGGVVKTSILTTSRGNFGSTGATNAGATQFWFLGNGMLFPSTVEANRHVTWHTPGILSKLYVRVVTNTTTLASTLTVRKNGADDAITITIPSATTGVFEDISNIVTVADGDELCYKTVSGGTGIVTFSIMSVLFDEAANTVTITKQIAMGRGATTSNTTQFMQISGDRSGTSAVEANMETRIKQAGVFKNAWLYVSANAKTTSTPITFRKNRTDTGITWTIPAGTTGIYEDVTNPISVTAEDEVDWKIVYALDAANITIENIAIDFENPDGYHFPVAGSTGATSDITQDFGTTNYYVISGAMREVTVESEQKLKTRIPVTYSGLTIHGQVNTINGNTTVKFRKNNTDGNQIINIGSGVAGWQSDDINTDLCDNNDELDIEITTGGSSGTITIRNISLMSQGTGGALRYFRTISEVGVDHLDAVLVRIRIALIETVIAIADTIVKRLFAKRSVNDNIITLPDEIFPEVKRTLSESNVIVIDNLNGIKKVTQALSNSIAFADNLVKRLFAKRTIANSITTNDSLALRIRMPLNETSISMLDALQRIAHLKRTVSDAAVDVFESLSVITQQFRSMVENISLGPSTLLLHISRSISEPVIGVLDSLSSIYRHIRSINETAITTNDNIILTRIKITLNETVNLVGLVAKRLKAKRTTTDSPIIIDDSYSWIKHIHFAVTITESVGVGISDTFSMLRVFFGQGGGRLRKRFFGNDFSFK